MESKALDKSIAMEPVTFLETPQMIAFFASQKSRGLSTFRLPEVRPISTFPMKQLEYLENAWVIFSRLSREIFQSEDDSSVVITSKTDTCIKRKISLSKSFQNHCLSSYAQVFYHFFLVVVLLKGVQRLLEKRETQQISTPIRIRSRIFVTRHAVTSRYCFAHFQKWQWAWGSFSLTIYGELASRLLNFFHAAYLKSLRNRCLLFILSHTGRLPEEKLRN